MFIVGRIELSACIYILAFASLMALHPQLEQPHPPRVGFRDHLISLDL
jgi:hypothetical protein